MILVVKPFEAAHKEFDGSFIEELRYSNVVEYVDYSSRGFLYGLFRSILISYNRSYEKVFILNTLNLFIPLYSLKSRIVLHNNLERRFHVFLKYYQRRCISICDAQFRTLPYTQYYAHPLPEVVCRLKKKNSLLALLNNDDNVSRGVEIGSNIGVKDVLFGWAGGHGYIPDLENELCQSKYLLIDRDYSLRASSIVALALAAKCIVIVFSEDSAKNLARTFGASLRKELNLWFIELK